MRKYFFIAASVLSAAIISPYVYSDTETSPSMSRRIEERIRQAEISFAHAFEFEQKEDYEQAYAIDRDMIAYLCEPFYFSKVSALTLKEYMELKKALDCFLERLKVQGRYKSKDGQEKLMKLEEMARKSMYISKKGVHPSSAREENLKKATCQGDN